MSPCVQRQASCIRVHPPALRKGTRETIAIPAVATTLSVGAASIRSRLAGGGAARSRARRRSTGTSSWRSRAARNGLLRESQNFCKQCNGPSATVAGKQHHVVVGAV